MRRKVVVFGGTGYVGSYICKELSREGFFVVSISQSGENKYLSEKDARGICFVKADILTETSWHEHLDDCFAVVNAIGLLIQHKSKNITYRRLIFETTHFIAKVAKAKGIKNFVQISAIRPPFFMLRKYNKYKIEAEKYVKNKGFRLLIVRPRVVVSSKKPLLLFLYRIQEFLHLPFKMFDPIIGIPKRIISFLG
jgi:NADH dehydrogenase